MNVRAFHALLFLALFAGLTVLVFPRRVVLVDLYRESGNIKASQQLVEALMDSAGEDYRTLFDNAEIHHLLGDPDRAIANMEKAVALKPRNKLALTRLADYYRWNLKPRQALQTYERIARIYPGEIEVYIQMIDLYRHFKDEAAEHAAIAQAIPLMQAGLAARQDLFLNVLRGELAKLARQFASAGPDPLRNDLMRRLYILTAQYTRSLDEGQKPDRTEFVTYALEHYMSTGQVDQGLFLAGRFDQVFNAGMEYRKRYMLVLEWNGLPRQALDLLDTLAAEAPGDMDLVLIRARLAQAVGDKAAVRRVLADLEARGNLDATARRAVGRMHEDLEEYGRAVDLYRDLWRSGHAESDLKRLLAAGLASGRPELLARAVAEAPAAIEREDVQAVLAQAYAEQERPREAFALLAAQVRAKVPGSEALAPLLLTVAAATQDPAVIAEAQELVAGEGGLSSPPVLRSLAEAYLGAERPDLAVPLLARLVRDAGRTVDRADLLRLLEAASFTGRPDLAGQAADLARRLVPRDPEVQAKAAEALLAADRPKEALPLLAAAARARGKDAGREELQRLLEVAGYAGEPEAARSTLDLVLSLRPGDPVIRRAAADAYVAAGDPARAYPLHKEQAQARPTPETVGLMLQTAGYASDPKLMADAADAARRLLAPLPPDLKRRVADLYSYSARPRDAAGLYAELAAAGPGDPELEVLAGQAFGAAAQFGPALDHLKRAVALRPGEARYRRLLAQHLGYAGRTRDMVAAYERMRELKLLSAADRTALGQGYAGLGQWAKAVEELAPLADKESLTRAEGLLLSTTLANAGRDKEAQALFIRLSRQYRDDPQYLARLGYGAMFASDLAAAENLFSATLRRDAGNAPARKGRAMVHAAANDPLAAVRLYQEYLSRNPDDLEAHYRLGELYSILDRPGQAKREYDAARRLLREKQAAPPRPQAANP